MSTNLRFLQTFMACVGHTTASSHHSTLDEVVYDLILHPEALRSVRGFFGSRGWDPALVTTESLYAAAVSLGFVETPLRSFKEMQDVLAQHAQGLVTEAEAILALQCTKIQVQAVCAHQNLPLKIHRASSLADWDDWVATRHTKADPKNLTSWSTSDSASQKPNVRDISFVSIGRHVLHVPTKQCLLITGYDSMTTELSPNDKVCARVHSLRSDYASAPLMVPIGELEPVPAADQRLRLGQEVDVFTVSASGRALGTRWKIAGFELFKMPEQDRVFVVELSNDTGKPTSDGEWVQAIYVQPHSGARLLQAAEDFSWVEPMVHAVLDHGTANVDVEVLGVRHSHDVVEGLIHEAQVVPWNSPAATPMWISVDRLTPATKKQPNKE